MHSYHIFKNQAVQQDFQNFEFAVLLVALLQATVLVLQTAMLYS